MGERRHAKKVILVRRGDSRTRKADRKIEIFSGDLFPGKTFVDILSEPIDGNRDNLYRLRVNGKWFPARKKMLYDSQALNEIIAKLIGEM